MTLYRKAKIMDYAKNSKYFTPVNYKTAIILIVIGVFLLAAIIGIVLIIIGVVMIVLQNKGRPTDAEIDAAVNSQLGNMQERALRKLGIDGDEVREIAPISFDGYVYRNAYITRGKDGIYRSSKYQAVMLFFSADEIHCYTYDFSLINNNQQESTDVYFYKDIVSVSTQTDGGEYSVGKGKSSKFDYEYFKLTTTGGTSISCTVSNADDAQRSINGMRSLIKTKKMA
ncbi:MAG: hypothetical protein NC452_19490 [Eubacterium sp.]|nr:hypothetical protein [Eubacterium sp.]